MSRILLVWELGAGTGHLHQLASLGRVLAARGHDTVFALRDLARSEEILGAEPRRLQAPAWQTPSRLPPAATYAELLFRVGYLDPAGLGGLVRAWRTLYELVAPDLLVANHAPTALLAARGLGLPSAQLGTGFELPPNETPLRQLQPWKPLPTERLLASERTALGVINEALSRVGVTPLDALAEVFHADERFLCTMSELDHHGPREGVSYWGTPAAKTPSALPDWPSAEGPKIFAYYHAAFPQFPPLARGLASLGVPALLVAPGIPRTVANQLASSTLVVRSDQVDLQAVTRDCSLAITAGHGTAVEMLLAGLPLMVIPAQLEQTLLAHRLADQGLAATSHISSRDADCRPAIRAALENQEIVLQARRFAEQYAAFDLGGVASRIGERCEALL